VLSSFAAMMVTLFVALIPMDEGTVKIKESPFQIFLKEPRGVPQKRRKK
jgi:hypothetical protein